MFIWELKSSVFNVFSHAHSCQVISPLVGCTRFKHALCPSYILASTVCKQFICFLFWQRKRVFCRVTSRSFTPMLLYYAADRWQHNRNPFQLHSKPQLHFKSSAGPHHLWGGLSATTMQIYFPQSLVASSLVHVGPKSCRLLTQKSVGILMEMFPRTAF